MSDHANKCKWRFCAEKVWKEERCIFHSMDIEAKSALFLSYWKDFVNRYLVSGDGELNCRKFVFPPSFKMPRKTLPGISIFDEAVFLGYIGFDGVIFEGSVSFEKSIFKSEVSFIGTQFQDRVSFYESYFQGNLHFLGTSFSSDAFFHEAYFSGKVLFQLCKTRIVDFNRAILEKADFRHSSLSGFQMTNILVHKKVKFGPTDISDVNWTGSYLLREQALDQNYLHDYKIAHPILFRLWSWSCDCGRSLLRWTLLSLIIALGYGAIYWRVGEDTFYIDQNTTWNWISPYYYSIVTFTTLGFGDITPKLDIWWAQLVVTLEVIIGYIMLGGLISIFATKIARRAN